MTDQLGIGMFRDFRVPVLGVAENRVRAGERPKLSRSRPDLPARLAALVDRMVSPVPDDRPSDAAEALAALTATTAPVEQVTTVQGTQTVGGTLPFMAPELLDQPPRFGPRSDIYALGMTLACLALERDPFPSEPLTWVVDWVRGGERPRLARSRPDLPPAPPARWAHAGPVPRARGHRPRRPAAEQAHCPGGSSPRGASHRSPASRERKTQPSSVPMAAVDPRAARQPVSTLSANHSGSPARQRSKLPPPSSRRR